MEEKSKSKWGNYKVVTKWTWVCEIRKVGFLGKRKHYQIWGWTKIVLGAIKSLEIIKWERFIRGWCQVFIKITWGICK